MRYALTAFFLVLNACTASPEDDPAAVNGSDDVIANAIGAALQGNARLAVDLLDPIDGESLNAKDRQFRSRMLERFGDPAPHPDASPEGQGFGLQLTDLFRDYWRKALTNPEAREDLETQLDLHLSEILGLPDGSQINQIENAVQERLEAVGLHGLLGRTGVLRELMIWRQEDRKAVAVEMPHGSYRTQVAFLDDFIVSGWGQYSTCEMRGAGGWVAERTLFAVVPLYDSLDGEEFRVTFLGHETQHFLDLDKYPDIEPWELEYRAKLIELSLADATRLKVLQKFMEDQGDDPASPHSYANRRVLHALATELSLSNIDLLKSIGGDLMRKTAISLYDADTALRDSRSH